jgi:predicted permease
MDDDLQLELDTHLEFIKEEERARGLSPEEARHKARARFGNPLSYREQALDAVVATWLENGCKEVAFATRRLVRSPAFTLASVLTLALAIGANVAIFAVVERVVLNPLPYPDSDRLIELDHGSQRLNVPSGIGMTQGLYYHYSERALAFDDVALYGTDEMTLTGDGEPERIRVARATPSLASLLRVSPALGRWFTENESVPGAPPVAVLSHGLWVRRYSRDPGILGRPVMLGGVPTEVVGIMPASYAFPDPRVDVWTAVQVARAMGFGLWSYSGVARLRDNATVEDARAELNGLIADLPQAFPSDAGASANGKEIQLFSAARTLKDATVGSVARALWILLASVGLVLLVACANVANLFLVRSEARQREIALRRALGAGRLGIARYFLTESALLSIAGGVIGLVLAWGAVRLLVAFGPTNFPRLGEVGLDAVVLVFTFGLSMLAALAFGVIPLWRGAPPALSLHESGRSNTASRGGHRARHLLMGGQVALALVLLVSSGLMVRSFQKLRAVDPGFNASSTVTFSVGLPDRGYPTRAAAVAAHHAILDRLSTLPGVRAVSAATCLPLAGACWGNTLRVEGRANPPGAILPLALFRAVGGGYFEAMGIRVLRGRSIDPGDVERNEPVVVINQALADRFFPNQDPIGERVASNRPPARGEALTFTWLTIVGVVSNTPARALVEANPPAQLYMPMSIAGGPDVPALVGPNVAVMTYVVRSTTPPLGLLPAVRVTIDAVDAKLALAQARTLQDILDGASAQMAFTMVLIAVAATVALLLGVIGIYGVMSYIVAQRTGEIGLRLALGAEPGSVVGMIVRQGGLAALAGIALGLATAFAGTRLIESLLYDVSPRDPGIFAATTLMLLGVTLFACWLPARRAARLNPLEALRAD